MCMFVCVCMYVARSVTWMRTVWLCASRAVLLPFPLYAKNLSYCIQMHHIFILDVHAINALRRGASYRASRQSPTMSGKKETVLDLGKFIDKGVRVKLSGGREGARINHPSLAPCGLMHRCARTNRHSFPPLTVVVLPALVCSHWRAQRVRSVVESGVGRVLGISTRRG